MTPKEITQASPASSGQSPVREALLPYGRQLIDDDDIAAVVDVLKSDWITQGPVVEAFEHRVAEYCGAEYAVAMASGTAALHAACATAGIGAAMAGSAHSTVTPG